MTLAPFFFFGGFVFVLLLSLRGVVASEGIADNGLRESLVFLGQEKKKNPIKSPLGVLIVIKLYKLGKELTQTWRSRLCGLLQFF